MSTTKKQRRTLSTMEYLRSCLNPVDRKAGAIIFLTSADVVGYRVAIRLKEGGSKVRVGVASDRAGSQLSHDLKEQGVSQVPFSWEDESTYSKAVQGAKTVFCIVSPQKGWVKRFHAFFDVCRKSGVKHFVKLSFYNAFLSTLVCTKDNPFCNVPLIKMHGECDGKVIRSRAMDYTILFATHLMSDPAVNQRHNIMFDPSRFYSASAGKGVNYVSPNDIAAAAVRVLVNPRDHRRVGYTLTGPTHITDSQVADLLSKDLNKTVECVDVAPDDYGSCIYKTYNTSDAMVDQRNTEPKYVDVWDKKKQARNVVCEKEKQRGDPQDDLVQLENLKATGMEVQFLSQDFKKLCRRPAETFGEYLDAKSKMTPAELLI